jgi:hypothetical protein
MSDLRSISVCRRRRRLNFIATEGSRDLLSGQPGAPEAPASYRIRASEARRHENRNDKNLLPLSVFQLSGLSNCTSAADGLEQPVKDARIRSVWT